MLFLQFCTNVYTTTAHWLKSCPCSRRVTFNLCNNSFLVSWLVVKYFCSYLYLFNFFQYVLHVDSKYPALTLIIERCLSYVQSTNVCIIYIRILRYGMPFGLKTIFLLKDNFSISQCLGSIPGQAKSNKVAGNNSATIMHRLLYFTDAMLGILQICHTF